MFQGGDTNGDTFLDPGEVWTYEATGTAVAGQYANTATVTGTPGQEFDGVLTDSDPSHYFGLVASIDIVKTPDAAVVDFGAPHTFTITVTNTSNVNLTGVTVSDPVTPACDRAIGTMTPGQVVTYTCTVAQVVQHINNIASVQGVAPDGTVVTDQDPAEVTILGVGGNSSLGDLVWVDTNQNGVQDGGEPGHLGGAGPSRPRSRHGDDHPVGRTGFDNHSHQFVRSLSGRGSRARGLHGDPGPVLGVRHADDSR